VSEIGGQHGQIMFGIEIRAILDKRHSEPKTMAKPNSHL